MSQKLPQLKPGLKFRHKRWTDPDGDKVECRVVGIDKINDVIVYRPVNVLDGKTGVVGRKHFLKEIFGSSP